MNICTRPGCQTTAGCQCVTTPPLRGWLCPSCSRAHGPMVSTCPEPSPLAGLNAIYRPIATTLDPARFTACARDRLDFRTITIGGA